MYEILLLPEAKKPRVKAQADSVSTDACLLVLLDFFIAPIVPFLILSPHNLTISQDLASGTPTLGIGFYQEDLGREQFSISLGMF